jgi:DNA processing protein
MRSSNILRVPKESLKRHRRTGNPGHPPDVIEDLFSKKSSDRAEQEWRRVTDLGMKIIDLQDPGYPPLPREVFDPPIILLYTRYIRGKKWDAELPQVAIVRTRKPTGYGLNCAERLAEDLAARGIAVTSGLARGLDAAAPVGPYAERHHVCRVW